MRSELLASLRVTHIKSRIATKFYAGLLIFRVLVLLSLSIAFVLEDRLMAATITASTLVFTLGLGNCLSVA